MKHSSILINIALVLMLNTTLLWSQPTSRVYLGSDSQKTEEKHELKMTGDYIVHSRYTSEGFISTIGGYYTADSDSLYIKLEFNSNFENDSISQVTYGYVKNGDNLILNTPTKLVLNAEIANKQDLDGNWLFATRGPDTGQDRRGDENPRKTLKFLMDGRFQWIAYNTETMRFSGTGGGSYTAENGIYTEKIEYFSRDSSRVGAVLDFNYEIKGNDWHHTGNNSRGEPMYEIWARR